MRPRSERATKKKQLKLEHPLAKSKVQKVEVLTSLGKIQSSKSRSFNIPWQKWAKSSAWPRLSLEALAAQVVQTRCRPSWPTTGTRQGEPCGSQRRPLARLGDQRQAGAKYGSTGIRMQHLSIATNSGVQLDFGVEEATCFKWLQHEFL